LTYKQLYVLIVILLVFILSLWLRGPIPQHLDYHNFADKQSYFGIPNFWNVVSNLPMLFLGMYGLWQGISHWHWRLDLASKCIPVVLSLGIMGASVGSAWYHWAPDNATLVWDRLPMTLVFMPLFALIIYKFVGKEVGTVSFYFLIPLGVFSVLYWQHTETTGHGDLRFYIFVQYFPMLILPFLLWLSPHRPSYIRYILFVLGWYVLAKCFEHTDYYVYGLTHFWSGHTIKHLLAALSLWYVLKLTTAWEAEMARTR